MKYAVHLYTQVRVKVTGLQADDMAQAIEKAESAVDLHDLLDNKQLRASTYSIGDGVTVECVEWAEGVPDFFLVDPLLENGEVDYENVGHFGPDGLPLADGKSTIEQKAEKADLAGKFMQELLGSVETLTNIAEQHGSRTLADIMYLHSAILSGGFIDHCPDESSVLDIARTLPSGDAWVKYIKIEHMASAAA